MTVTWDQNKYKQDTNYRVLSTEIKGQSYKN